MTAIILTDGKAGHENQSKAFVRALGLEARLVPVRFKSPAHKTLSYLLDRLGIRTTALFDFGAEPGEAKWVVGTGSGTFYAAKALSRRLGARCGVVLYPRGYRLPSFNCILAPSFDRPASLPNVVEIPANLVANDAAFYDKGVAAFKERYAGPTESLVGVIVGGPNKCFPYPVHRERLGEDLPPAKYYLDELPSADTNEIAIYWNSPTIFVGAFFIMLSHFR